MRGVTFGTKHSYDDFGLLLKSKSVGFPEAKLELVDVSGRDGKLDLTDAISDTVKYKNRTLSFVFTKIGNQSDFFEAVETVANYLHGEKMRVILDDDPAYYYYGRCKVNKFQTDKKTATIQVDVDAEPYKMEINSAGQRWQWDTFNFRYGVIHTSEFTISGSQTVNLINLKKVVSPTFTCSAAMTVTFNSVVYDLVAGEQTIYDIRLREGNNYLTFNGTGTVSVRYEGGCL